MTYFIVFIAVVLAVVGAVSLTRATEGVGFIALACFLGILARMWQASDHNLALRQAFWRIEHQKTPPPSGGG